MKKESNFKTCIAVITIISLFAVTAFPMGIPARQDKSASPGTLMIVSLTETIGSDRNQPGDTVHAKLIQDLISGSGAVVFPVGTQVVGKVKAVERPGRGQSNGSIEFVFERLVTANGNTYPIVANLEGASKFTRNSWKKRLYSMAIAIGSGILISKIFGGSIRRGILLGGAAGTGYVLYREGEDVVLDAGTSIRLVLEEMVTVSYDFPASDTTATDVEADASQAYEEPATDAVTDEASEAVPESEVIEQAVETATPDTTEKPEGDVLFTGTMANGPKVTVTLKGGDVQEGDFNGISDDRKMLIKILYGQLTIPVADIKEIVFDDSIEGGAATFNDDGILFTNGNAMNGYFLGFTNGKIVFSTDYGELKVPVEEIAKITIGN